MNAPDEQALEAVDRLTTTVEQLRAILVAGTAAELRAQGTQVPADPPARTD